MMILRAAADCDMLAQVLTQLGRTAPEILTVFMVGVSSWSIEFNDDEFDTMIDLLRHLRLHSREALRKVAEGKNETQSEDTPDPAWVSAEVAEG